MIQQIKMPKVPQRGEIVRVCTGALCTSYKVTRVRITGFGVDFDLIEAAGSLALDPMIVYYNERIHKGDLPKVARAKACKKFKLKERQFFNRLAAR